MKQGKVTKVHDGDTFWAETPNGTHSKYRMHSIDAPEMKQAYGSESRDALERKMPVGGSVSLQQAHTDKYGRSVVNVFTPGGTHVNEHMVREGHAHPAKGFVPKAQKEYYSEAAKAAKESSKGIWLGETEVEMPWNFRKSK